MAGLFLHSFLAQAQTRDFETYWEAAVAHNPDVLAAQNQSQIALLENKKVQANYHVPQVALQGNWMEAPTFNGYGYDAAVTNGAWYNATVGASLPLFSKTFSQTESRQNTLQAQQFDFQKAYQQHRLRFTLTSAYIICYADVLLQQKMQAQSQLLAHQVQIGERLAKSGILKATEVLQLRIALQEQQNRQKQLESQYEQDIAALNALAGVSYAIPDSLVAPELNLQDSLSSASTWKQKFLTDSLLNLNQQKQFNLRYQPKVSLYGDAGYNTATLQNAGHFFGASVGVSLSWKIFDGHQKEVQAQQLQLQQETVQQQQKYQLQNLQVQRESQRQKVQQLEAQVKRTQEELQNYQALLNAYQKELTMGEVSVTNYLLQYQNYIQKQQDLIMLQQQKLQAINAYNFWNW